MTRKFAVLSFAALSALGQSSRYAIQPADANRLELHVAKTGLYKGKVHVFLFPKYQGSLNYDPRNPESSQVNLTLAAADIKLTDTWLSAKDFRSVQEYAVKDMLNTAKFPEIAFASLQVRAVDPTHFEVRGILSIRGVGKPSVVNVSLQPSQGAGPRLEGKSIIKLTDYGLKPPTAALGLVGTKDEMDFTFVLALPPGN